METIRVVIFDWGGVLIEDPAGALLRYCADVLGVGVEDYTRAYRLFEVEFVTGKITEDRFWSKVCGELGVSKPKVSSLWGQAFAAAYKPKEEVFALAGKLHKNGYKTAVLSNTERPSVDFFFRQGYDMFDATVFSCLEGVKKPEREIYGLVVSRLGVKSEECIFIDDRIECVEGAKAAGLKAVLFENTEQVRSELSKLGVKTG